MKSGIGQVLLRYTLESSLPDSKNRLSGEKLKFVILEVCLFLYFLTSSNG